MVYLGRNAVGMASAYAPTDEQVRDAVDDYLEEHPEATTTVQDGTISEAKLTDVVNSKLFAEKVYASDYLDGDGIFHSIASKDSNVTLAQVQALNPNATVNSSYDWYVLQTLINTVPNHTTIVLSGNYVIDVPLEIKRGYFNIISKNPKMSERSKLIFTLADKNTDFITIGLVGTEQIQRINFEHVHFCGTFNYVTGDYSGNGIVMNNKLGYYKSDCMAINFDSCIFSNFKNGIYVADAFYISSIISNCSFNYNIENGFYGKHTGTTQINEIRFINIGSLCNGLEIDTNQQKAIPAAGGEYAIINISGCGISINNVGGMLSNYGIIINDGSTQGMNISGMYLEAMHEKALYIKGTSVTNLCIFDAFASDIHKSFISTDNSILLTATYPLLAEKAVKQGVFQSDIPVLAPTPLVAQKFINNKYQSTYKRGDTSDICDVRINRAEKVQISFDYEYMSDSLGYDNYAFVRLHDKYGNQISPWIRNDAVFYQSIMIKDNDPISGYIVTLQEPYPEDADVTFTVQMEDTIYNTLYHDGEMIPPYLNFFDQTGATPTISENRMQLDYGNSPMKVWLGQNKKVFITPIVKNSSTTTGQSEMRYITPMYSRNGTVVFNLDFLTDTLLHPIFADICTRIRVCFNNRMSEGQEVRISNLRARQIFS